MAGQQVATNKSQPLSVTLGLDNPAFLSLGAETLPNTFNFLEVPFGVSSLNGLQPTVANLTEDLSVSSLNGYLDVGVLKVSDNVGPPMNVLLSSSDSLLATGSPSPIVSSHHNMAGLPFHSVVSGGDKMLSAVNTLGLSDQEILGDAAFDSAPSAGLSQFDDGLLGGGGQAMRLGEGTSGTSFELFDGGVTDTLSLSPQPFTDAGLMPESTSVLDTGLIQTDSTFDNPMRPQSNKTASSTPPVVEGEGQDSKTVNLQCNVCAKTFNSIGALAKHKLTHSDLRKYVCNVCSKGFKRQDHLNGHRMTHLDKKPFECQFPTCDKSYCEARSLRRHLEQHHHLDPETIQSHVQASMAASGIPSPTNGGKNRDKGGKLSSPVYSPGSATPTPSPGSAGVTSGVCEIDLNT